MIKHNSSTNTIEISSENISFIDIVNSINDSSIIDNIGDSFEIYSSISLNNSTISDVSKNIIIHGNYFIIDENSSLRLGNKNPDNSTELGCSLKMTNPALAYGFGNPSKSGDSTLSGNLFLYNSIIDIWCFWGFFGGPSKIIEIENCIINGFGRIEGTQSTLRNIIFEKSNSKYGILSPKGSIKELYNLSSQRSDDCSIYFNPTYTENMNIIGGVYQNFNKLVYMENNTRSSISTIRFTDSIIKGVFDCTWGNNTRLEIAYTFNPVFIDDAGNKIDIDIQIKNNLGELVFTGTSSNGSINTELIYYEASDSNTSGQTLSPFTLNFTLPDGTKIDRVVDINTTIKQIPLIVSGSSETGSSNIDLSAIESLIKNENQLTRDYMLSMNDITYQDVRVLSRYGYKPRSIVGDPSNVVLARDNNIVLPESRAEEIYNNITFDNFNKIVDCQMYKISDVYHACNYKNYIEKSDEVIMIFRNDKYGCINNWKLKNYRGRLDFYYEDSVRIYPERDVDFIIYLGSECISGNIHLEIYSESNTLVSTEDISINQPTISTTCPTNDKYTYIIQITDANDNIIFKDSSRIPIDGVKIRQRIQFLDPDLQAEVGYFNASNNTLNTEHKAKLKNMLGDSVYNSMDIFTDISDDAYDARGSYNIMMKMCARGEIKRIYMWDKSEFGIVRKDISLDLLSIFNIDIIEIKNL